MGQINEIQSKINQLKQIKDVTETFEQITTIKIKNTKENVESSIIFFNDVWEIYKKLRILKTKKDKMVLEKLSQVISKNKKEGHAFILIASSFGLAGDLNSKLIERLTSEMEVSKQKNIKTKVYVIGIHGKSLLAQKEIDVEKVYDFPEESEKQKDVIKEVINDVNDYEKIYLFYAEFVSLSTQNPNMIELTKQYNDAKLDDKEMEKIISPENYIFEPSVEYVIEHFESIIMGIALSQKMSESLLSQYASRLIAMERANKRASDLYDSVRYKFNSEQRNVKDKGLKEIFAAFNIHKNSNKV